MHAAMPISATYEYADLSPRCPLPQEADPRVRAEHEFRTQSDLEAAKRSKMDEILFGNLGNDALKGNWGQGTFGSKDPGRGRAERRD